MLEKGDLVVIAGSAEASAYDGNVFEVVSNEYEICGSKVVKMICRETGKYFGGGYSTQFLEKVGNINENN